MSKAFRHTAATEAIGTDLVEPRGITSVVLVRWNVGRGTDNSATAEASKPASRPRVTLTIVDPAGPLSFSTTKRTGNPVGHYRRL
jgi:hypothetical protein